MRVSLGNGEPREEGQNLPEETQILRIATYNSLAYSPQFVAEEIGLYAKHGLAVSFVTSTRRVVGLAEAVSAGEADLMLANLWFPLSMADTENHLVPIAQCNQQCYHVLVGRKPADGFSWAQLRSKVVVLPSEAPTPWVALRYVLRKEGISLDEAVLLPGFMTPQDAIREFQSGVGDYLLIAAELAQQMDYPEVASLAYWLGPVPWSVYAVPRRSIARLREQLTALWRALSEALAWVSSQNAREVATVLAARFGMYDRNLRARILNRYKRLGLWPSAPDLDIQQSERWQAIMVEFGLIRHPLSVASLLSEGKL